MTKRENAEEDYITTPISVLRYRGELETQLAEARKSLGDSINYRVFNLTADEAVIALRRAEQLKEKGE